MIVASKLPSQYMLGVRLQQMNDLGSVMINGCHPHGGADLFGGYGLTRDVPKDIWERWCAAHAASDLVLKNLIHAEETEAEIKAWISAHQGSQSS